MRIHALHHQGGISLFSATKTRPETAIQTLFRVHGSPKKIKRKALLNPGADDTKRLYVITKGSVRVTLNNEDGDDVIHLCFLQPGDVFGEEGLFDSGVESLSNATLHARTDVEVISVPHAVVERQAEADPRLYSEISSQINRRLARTTTKLAQVLFLDLEQRCYDSLIDMTRLPDAMTHPDGMQIKLTRIDLAQMVRCSRETAGRLLKTLAQKNMVSVQGQSIVVNGVRNRPPLYQGQL